MLKTSFLAAARGTRKATDQDVHRLNMMSADILTSCPSHRKLGENPEWRLTVDLIHLPKTGKKVSHSCCFPPTRKHQRKFSTSWLYLSTCPLELLTTSSKAQKAWKAWSPSKFLPWSVWIITGTPNRTTYCSKKACATDCGSWVTSGIISNQRVNWSMTIRTYLLPEALSQNGPSRSIWLWSPGYSAW